MKKINLTPPFIVSTIALAFVLGLSAVFQNERTQWHLSDQASREPAQALKVWTVSGYLPENPQQKVYVTVNGRAIQQVQIVRPNGYVVETDSLIFPGLIDMHSHIKYNILPLWSLGKSQFLNRFEWRQKFAPYKNAVSFNMQPIKGDTTCAAVRWAEIKSLVGGASAIQGIGGDSKCAAAFGVLNVEIPNELAPQKIRAMTDLISPDAIGSVYLPGILPEIQRRYGKNRNQNIDIAGTQYDQALLQLLQNSGVLAWMDKFANDPRTISNGILLMTGFDPGPLPDSSFNSFELARPAVEKFLIEKHRLNPKALEKQIANMRIWLYGKNGKGGYLSLPMPNSPLKGMQLVATPKVIEYLGKGGVISLDRRVRRYLAMFETSVRRSVLNTYQRREALAIVAHLAEGGRRDIYNQSEYKFAVDLGLARQGLVMIHAVGLDNQQLFDAAQRGLSIVWSPFSNLLLYGETLDVVAAKHAGLNIAIGADWSPTGSKNILDELKIARRYLNKIGVPLSTISDRDLVNMASVNAARALNISQYVGTVAPRMMANLLLIDRKILKTIPDPWSALIASGQENIQLSVVSGEPLYGDVALIQNFSEAFRDFSQPETLPRGNTCQFKKAIRFPWFSGYDKELQVRGGHLHTLQAIETELRTKMDGFAQAVKINQPKMAGNLAWLDPLFSCEDQYYQNEFNRYIEFTLDVNRAQRSNLRKFYQLDDRWTPLKAPTTDADDESDLEKNPEEEEM